MPRESPFAIVLSKEERLALEAQARQYTSPYCDVVRAKIVLLAAEGLSNASVVTSKPAICGYFKTSQRMWPGTGWFYANFSCSGMSVFVRQFRGPHLRT